MSIQSQRTAVRKIIIKIKVRNGPNYFWNFRGQSHEFLRNLLRPGRALFISDFC
jgi:hypothetical protein